MRPAMRIANGDAKSRPSSHSPAGAMAVTRSAAVSSMAAPKSAPTSRIRNGRSNGARIRVCSSASAESIISPSDARTRFCSTSTVVAVRGLSASRAAAWPVTSHPPRAGSHDTGSASRSRSSTGLAAGPLEVGECDRRPGREPRLPRGGGGVRDLGLLQQRRHGATVPARRGIVSRVARVPTAAVAAGSLIGGYVVARETGVRPAGRRRAARGRRVVHALVAAHERAGRRRDAASGVGRGVRRVASPGKAGRRVAGGAVGVGGHCRGRVGSGRPPRRLRRSLGQPADGRQQRVRDLFQGLCSA